MPNASSPHLDADSNEKTRLGQQGEGLVVSDVLAVVPDRVAHGRPGDEEEDQGAVRAVHHAADEGLLTEVLVQLPRNVELWILEAPPVIHIL